LSRAGPLLVCFSPAGVVARAASVRLAVRRLRKLGFDARIDESALARHQRFAGDDELRLAAVHRVAREAPSVALATRGGYGSSAARAGSGTAT
jgi:muramoyltetrapeptide carboxypeptidase